MSLFDQIQDTLKTHDVVLYMKGDDKFPMCGFSSTVVRILKDLNVEFLAVNVLSDEELRESIKAFSNWPTIPQLYIKGEFIGGCDIVKEMYQMGELQDLLRDQGLLP